MCLETGETPKSFEYRNNDFCDTQTLHHYIYITIINIVSIVTIIIVIVILKS